MVVKQVVSGALKAVRSGGSMAGSAISALPAGSTVMASAGFGLDLATNIYAGDNVGTGLVKAAGMGIVSGAAPGATMLYFGGQFAKEGFLGYTNFTREKQQFWNKEFSYNNQVGGNYIDTQRAITMRQAAVQAIQGSKMNARSALGQEAKILNPYNTRRF